MALIKGKRKDCSPSPYRFLKIFCHESCPFEFWFLYLTVSKMDHGTRLKAHGLSKVSFLSPQNDQLHTTQWWCSTCYIVRKASVD